MLDLTPLRQNVDASAKNACVKTPIGVQIFGASTQHTPHRFFWRPSLVHAPFTRVNTAPPRLSPRHMEHRATPRDASRP